MKHGHTPTPIILQLISYCDFPSKGLYKPLGQEKILGILPFGWEKFK